MKEHFEISDSINRIKCVMYRSGENEINDIVIAVHGFCGHKDNGAVVQFSYKMFENYPDKAVICFDLPCHGDDDSYELKYERFESYLSSVIAYIKENYPNCGIYAYSTSFGAFLTLGYISRYGNPFIKVALRCPAINMDEVLLGIMSEENRDKLFSEGCCLAGFDRKITLTKEFYDQLVDNRLSETDFSQYSKDIIITHGTKDNIVPIDSVRLFAEKNGIKFIAIEKADHRFMAMRLMNSAIRESLQFFFC